MQKFISLFLVCALVGGLIATWIAPATIAWYFEPPVNIGINCRPATEWAMQKLQWAQLFGFVGGGVLGGFLFFVVRRNDMKGDIK